MIKKIFFLILAVKISTLLLIFLAYNLLPFNKNFYASNFTYPTNEKITVSTAYKTWDGQHYLYLSEKGYGKEFSSDAFYPLYPESIKFVNQFLHNSLLSGLLISNILSFIAIFIFYFFVKDFYNNKEIAFTAVLLLLSFPTSFYFSLVYTESIFFFILIAFFYYLYKKKFFTAAFFSFLLPLSRSVGIFLLFPFLSYFINLLKFRKWSPTGLSPKIFLVLFPIVGFLTYLLFMRFNTGNFFEGINAQQANIAQWNISYLYQPDVLLIKFFSPNLMLHDFTNSILDRSFFVVFLLSLRLIYKHTDRNLFIISLLFGLIPPLLGSFMSYTRYMLVVFPLFMSVAFLLESKKYNFLKFPLIFFSFSIQMLLLIMHALNYWVA